MANKELILKIKESNAFMNITKDMIYDFMNNELSVQTTRKNATKEWLIENLTKDNLEQYYELSRFGLLRSNAREFIGVSEYKFKKLLDEGIIKISDSIYVQIGRCQHVALYSMKSLIEYLESK